jgi:hypothetical protein
MTVNENSILDNCNYLLTGLYDVHPLSTIVELSNNYKYNTTYISKYDDVIDENVDKNKISFARANNLFPKNKMTFDLLFKTKLYEPNLFTSLEAADDILSQEDAILGNNANYSFFGQLGGAVTEQEEANNKIAFEESGLSNESYNKLDSEINDFKFNNIISKWNNLFKKYILDNKELKLS